MRRSWFALLSVLAGCLGSIGAPSQEPGDSPPAVAAPASDPGRVTVHRLNRAEYNNTVRDLLGTKLRPADEFPTDDTGYGFDNIADVLSLSPLHLELYQHAAEVLVDEAMAPDRRAQILTCDPAADGCLGRTVRSFARRAWRRPVTDDEVGRLTAFAGVAAAEGDTAEAGLRLALRAILVAPQFIFRLELDPDAASSAPHLLGDHELAARLSYFVWSSMPDDELFAAADAGRLREPAAIRAQVERMLASPRAEALVQNFAGQWLYLRKLDDHKVSAASYPRYGNALRDAMRAETEAWFRQAVSGALPLDQMLTRQSPAANAAMTALYGTSPRAGLLTQASLLTVTSRPNRTAPVLRGEWVLDQLLCSSPPPPPPDVPALKEEAKPTASLRQRLEQHRADPVCASCHALMDPIGFGLEHYDGIGAYRERDEGGPVDATGALPDGRSFDGAIELSRMVAQDPRFPACVAQQLYTYALGRGPEATSGHLDATVIADLGARLASGGYRLRDLAAQIATADTFRMRRGQPDTGGTP
jgi:hypothetical protein